MMDDAPRRAADAAQPRDFGIGRLFWCLPNAVIVADADTGQIVLWNQGAEALFGYSAAEARGLPIEALIPERLRAQYRAGLACYRESGHGGLVDSGGPLDLPALRKTGEEIAIELTLGPIEKATIDGRFVLAIVGDGSERKRAVEAMRASDERFNEMAGHIREVFWMAVPDLTGISHISPGFEMLYISPGYERIWGRTCLSLYEQPRSWLEAIHPDDRVAVQAGFPRHREGEYEQEYRIVRPDGEVRWIRDRVFPIRDDRRVVYRVAGVAADITDRKQAEQALVQERQFLEAVLDNVQVGIVACDAHGVLTMFNRAMRELHGRPQQPVSADQWAERYDLRLLGDRALISKEEIPLFRALQGERLDRVELTIVADAGVARTVLVSGQAIVDPAGRKQGVVVAVHDITERRRAEDHLRHAALHDELTGLPNRTLFVDRLGQALQRAQRHPDHRFAVLFLDLDRFKNVNDSLGYAAGDRLLLTAAERLAGTVRPGDTVARLGGDEFVILLDRIEGLGEATGIADRIQGELALPLYLDGREVFVSTSIGIALGGKESSGPEDLLRDANTALYRAKALGKGRYAVFDTTMHARAVALLELETDLRRALERGELRLHYQPIMSLGTGELTRVEALVRWQHPRRGLIPPADFIPIAEETGLIVPLGEWVLRAACAQAKAWHDAGLSAVPVAVNMSAHQLERGSLREVVARTLRDTGLAPGHLELELTESAVMQDPIQAIEVLRGLRAAGVRIAIDDFGTGYSSLSYLTRLPIAGLKIDRSFVQNIMIDRTSETVTKAVVDLAHTLGLTVTAEGVETVEQMAFLRALGCDEAQGYLLGRPVPVDELAPLLRHGRSLWPRTTVAAAAHPRAAKGDSTGPHDGRGSVD